MTIVGEKKIEDFEDRHPDIDEDELEAIKEVQDHITPAFTFRSVFLGTIFCVVLSFANTCLSFRSAPFGIPAVAATIITYPIGIFMAKVLPSGFFNPGPFSMKEHVIIFIMASCSGQPYGIDNVVVQMHPTLMANTDISFMAAFGFVLVTQFLGYGFAGLTRRFLVRPTAMWWPGNITTIAIFSSFHNADTGAIESSRYTWTRTTLFWVSFVALFVYQWIPQMFAPALQAIAIACVFAGRGSGKPGVMTEFNAIAASVSNGSGLFGLTFDWTNIGSLNFAQPLYANLMNAAGNIAFLWIATPLAYQLDMFGLNKIFRLDYYSYSPLNPVTNTAVLFVGNPNSTKALGSRVSPRYFYDKTQNYNINMTAYENVAPVHLSANFILCYASSFLTITCCRLPPMNAFKQVRDEVDGLDKHVKMMEAYPDVPDWFYLIFMGVCTAGALLISLFTPFNMPWWGIFLNILLVGVFVVPYGAIQAITGVGMYLNVVSQFVIGLLVPGQTVAVMAFKSWGTNNLIQAFALSSDMKLGQYLHIPPYALITAQFVATFINSLVATCGLLRFFGIGSIHGTLMWCFLIGALCPLVPWLANKYVVKSRYWAMFNFAIFFQFAGPQSNQVYIVMPVLCAVFAQVYLFNRNKEFYQKYLYVMGAAFDAAAGIVSLVISMFSVAGIAYSGYWALNPNTDNVPLDYYCYPGADYNDWSCEYYLNMGENVTASGQSCV
ncbi:OPT oligopeptide transporter protein-domain-containing protein [Obelidium mucronatum]|nr:OPT oligopeptide transporter protein-domain-containing protein [Obelidium mucronatum]